MAAALGVVTWFSVAPAHVLNQFPSLFKHSDKVGHFFLYGLLVAVGRWALVPNWSFRLTFYPLVLGAIAYGILMELIQGLLVGYGRACEPGDILANSLGALAFWCLIGWLFPRLPAPVCDQAPAGNKP